MSAGEERGSWLNEADFLTGGGPSELADKEGANEQEKGEVQVRTLARRSNILWRVPSGAQLVLAVWRVPSSAQLVLATEICQE